MKMKSESKSTTIYELYNLEFNIKKFRGEFNDQCERSYIHFLGIICIIIDFTLQLYINFEFSRIINLRGRC